MAKEKSKADRIRELAAAGRSMKEIARRVGCSEAYARIYARQRRDGQSVADRNYKAKPETQERLRAYYKKNRKRFIAMARVWQKNNPERVKEINRLYYERNRKKRGHKAAEMGAAP